MEQKEREKSTPISVLSGSRTPEIELDELLADARRLSETTDYDRRATENPDFCVDLKARDDPNKNPAPGDPMELMAEQMRELKEEVQQLRAQLERSPQNGSEEVPAVRETPEQTRKSKVLNIISNVLFYLVIVGIIVGALLIKSSSGGRPTMIAGFSAFRVLTSSMEDVYPKGSLIITKSVEPSELAIGDDITFMVSETSSVTHRIIGITQNYLGTGKPGFETQGVMNEKPDKDMVASANVVGRVIFCSKALGDLANFMKNNWPLLIFAVVVFIALIAFLKWNARREDDEAVVPRDAPRKHVRK